MSWQAPKGMDEYLKPTELCDCDNVELQRKAKEIIKDAGNPKEAALKIFSFVRDGIPWSLDHCDTKASATLKKAWGDCVNKTNLQVALLRAVGIPARYHQGKIKREWLKGVISGFIYNKAPEIIWYHPWCECYLADKWVACDSILDKALFEAMLKEGLVTREQIPTIDWDGDGDLIVMKPWRTEDVGAFPSLDDVFRKAEKEAERPRIPAKLFGWFFYVPFQSAYRQASQRKEIKNGRRCDMSWQVPEGMDEYLKPTELCDCDNVELQSKAKEIIKDAETPKDAALKIFYFVREIPWTARPSDVKASTILEGKKGEGCNKTNLQVALLRAVGIPARHHQVKVKKEWHKGTMPSWQYNWLPEIAPFCSYCECYLSEKWVACESALDKALYEAMLEKGLVTKEQIPTIDWDGEKDLVVRAPWIAEDVGAFPSFDDGLKEATTQAFRSRVFAKLWGGFAFSRCNWRIDALRKGKK